MIYGFPPDLIFTCMAFGYNLFGIITVRETLYVKNQFTSIY